MKIILNGIYRHYKNQNLVRVVALAKDSESLKDLVVYEALYPNPLSRMWVRPYHEWAEIVKDHEGNKVNRFSFVKESDGEE